MADQPRAADDPIREALAALAKDCLYVHENGDISTRAPSYDVLAEALEVLNG